MLSKILLFSVFIACSNKISIQSEIVNCTVNFDLTEETEDQKYQEFMSELEEITFSLADNCPEPTVIRDLVWEYRLVVNRKYEDEVARCLCQEQQDDFDLCVEIVWEMKKYDLQAKRAEYYGFCGDNYEKLSRDKYTNIGVFPDYDTISYPLHR